MLNGLSREDQERLMLLMGEMKARGIKIPKREQKTVRTDWPVDSNGYFVRIDGKQYTPSEQQLAFLQSNAQFVAFTGGRGSGKTAAGAQKALRKIKQGESGAVLNPDFENFKYSTWPELKDWIPWDMVVPRQRYRKEASWEPHKPFTMVFMNGTRMICKGLKDPDSARGPNINWLWYDEGSRDLDGMGWTLAIASVRVGNDPQRWTTATPRGRDHWLHKLFVDKKVPKEVEEMLKDSNRPLIELFRGSIDDNKANLDPGFYASMIAAYPSGWLRKQELGGEFVDAGGILGNPEWFTGKMLDFIPEDVTFKAIVRYWDLAASEKKLTGKRSDDPDETVGTLMGWDGINFYIMDQVCGYWGYKELKEVICHTAEMDGPLVPVYIEQEPGAGGKNQVADIKSLPEMARYSVREHKPEGDKVLRANLWFGEAAAGRMYILRGLWVDHFLSQLSSFPISRHDDTIDSVSGARMTVAPIRKWRRVSFLKV